MASSYQVEKRFNAAVNVIRGLPKNGSYQPSNDMMLRFYSYFKQATLGPCTQKKPPFWDVVNKAKWDAYKSLGNLSRERSMELYVEELKKIIETMSFTDNVADFMGSMSELNGVDVEDLEAVAPDAIKKVKSQPNSPFASRESSPVRMPMRNGNGSYNEIVNHVLTNGNHHSEENLYTNGHSTAEHSDDEYIDTVEDDSILANEPIMQTRFSRSTTRRMDALRSGDQPISSSLHLVSANIEPAINQMLRTIDSMRVDLQQINNRINIVERSLTEVKNHQLRSKKITELKYPKWWPFSEISPNWFILLIVWPFVARRLVNMMQRKHR